MTEPPRSERERDLVREIADLVGGTPRRPRNPVEPPPSEPMLNATSETATLAAQSRAKRVRSNRSVQRPQSLP
jgi:hypothetical protein